MKDVSQLVTRKLLDEMMFTEIDNFVNLFLFSLVYFYMSVSKDSRPNAAKNLISLANHICIYLLAILRDPSCIRFNKYRQHQKKRKY